MCDLCGQLAVHSVFLKGAITLCFACYQGMARIERNSHWTAFDRFLAGRLRPAPAQDAAA